MTDDVLLSRMRRKDEAALAELYDRYSALLYTLALRIVGDRALAQEVIQDAFLRSWHEADQYDPARGRVNAWLMAVTRNRAIDLLRSRSHQARLREGQSLIATGQNEPDAADTSEQVLVRHMVSEALNALPADQRQAIELAYYGGLTQAEIAQRLGEPLGTVKTRVRAGLERLRGTLRPLIDSYAGTREHHG